MIIIQISGLKKFIVFVYKIYTIVQFDKLYIQFLTFKKKFVRDILLSKCKKKPNNLKLITELYLPYIITFTNICK